jgi:hypothetical protein
MKRFAVFAVLFFAAALNAQTRAITVGVHDTFVMEVFGATSAYTVDSAVADATVFNGTVTVFGRSAGRTQLVVVSITGQTTFEVTVPSSVNATRAVAASKNGSGARVESRYVSARQEVHNTVDITSETAKKRTQIHVENVNYREKTNLDKSATIPSVSYSIFTGKRELTLLDRVVDHSPLTISTGTVRGLHFVDDHWRVHLGYTAYAAYQSFLLPAERDSVLGVAYSIPVSSRLRVTPGVFAYPSAHSSVASLLVVYKRDDKTSARGELGYSNGSFGGAAELVIDREHHRLRADVRYRPRDFASVTPGQPRGLFADAVSSAILGRTTLDTTLSANDFDLPGFSQRTLSASSNARVRVTDQLSLLGGMSYGSFDTTRSILVPAGVQFDTQRFGITALYRYAQNSATNRGGNGFRLATRVSAGRVFASAFVDYQEQAPTLAVIFREQPDLALTLAQLGITATTPADIARALRENSALAALGYIEGVTVDLAPSRSQAGFEVAWLSSGPSRAQLRARLMLNRIETVATSVDTMIATISGSRRISDATDIYASYTRWITKRSGQEELVQPLFEIGIRHRFDSLPTLGARGTISGSVFIDEDLDGKPDGGGVADAVVEVDGATPVKTSSTGAFSVRVASGAHHITARVPKVDGAYFTTPSRVEASTGETVNFGVAITPARVFGKLTSDAGEALGGVTIALTRGLSRFSAISGSDGSYSIAAPPGEWDLGVDTMSLPAGFSSADAQHVRLDRDAPLTIALTLRANRSISGRVPAGVTSIFVAPLGRSISVSPDGRFSIRSLPAGEITLRAKKGSREIAKRVTLPAGPVIVADLDLR